ncbi:MAG TPA: MbnP family protein, partial [Cytophagaceae bacterium]
MSSSKIERYGNVELVIIPKAGEGPLFLDSIYTSSSGVQYSLKALRLFLCDIALARSTGSEYKTFSKENNSGIYLMDFGKPNFNPGMGKQSYKISFKAPVGEYSDIRYTIGVPRELNHSDPAMATGVLSLGQAASMYWEWNSGYIFFLADGKLYNIDNEDIFHQNEPYIELFHFAIGGDSRIMPLAFGNLFEIEPLLKIEEGKTTRIFFSLNFEKLLINGDNTLYRLNSFGKAMVHGGHYADVL